MTKAVILAGGFGNRLSPYTDYICKEMLYLDNGFPVIYKIVTDILESGIHENEICLVTRKFKIELNLFIKDYFPGIKIIYQRSGNKEDAISLAEKFIGYDDFILTFGDTLYKDSDIYNKLRNIKPMTIVVSERKDVSNWGVMYPLDARKDQINFLIEKPLESDSNLVVTGLYNLSWTIFDDLRKYKGKDLTEILNIWNKNVYEVLFLKTDKFYDVGTDKGYKEALKNIKCGTND